MAGLYNYSGKGGILSGSQTGFMPSLTGGGGGGGDLVGSIAKSLIPGGELISQVLNIIPSIFQSITGGRQLSQAKKLEQQYPRPIAEIAPSINRLTNYAYGRTLRQDIPGGEIARGEIKGATAAGLRAASELGSGSEAFGMLGELVGREQNQFADLAAQTAQQVAGYEGQYMDTLTQKAGEEQRVWEWNKAQPYLMAAQMAQQLRDSGTKNLFSGASNIFGSTAEAVSPDFNSTLMYGKDRGRNAGSIDANELMEVLKSFTPNK